MSFSADTHSASGAPPTAMLHAKTLALAGIIGPVTFTTLVIVSTFTMMAGIVVLLLFVTVGFFAIDDDAPLHPWAGLIQRILCAVWFTCLVVLAFRLRSLGSNMAVRGVHVSS